MTGNPLVEAYLTRLRVAAADLPPARGAELLAEVAEHIQAALAAAGSASEASVRNILDRLGPPEDTVAAEREFAEPGAPAMASATAVPFAGATAGVRSAWGPIEILAVLAFASGLLLFPFLLIFAAIGPIVGLILAWSSNAWTRREKVIVTIVAILSIAPMVALLGLFLTAHGTSGMGAS